MFALESEIHSRDHALSPREPPPAPAQQERRDDRTAITAMRSKLLSLKTTEIHQRALACGATEDEIEHCYDSDAPKHALMSLILSSPHAMEDREPQPTPAEQTKPEPKPAFAPKLEPEPEPELKLEQPDQRGSGAVTALESTSGTA